jgi:K+-transporting ATPase A subunit
VKEIGDVMHKFKKAAAVAAMVGGLGLVGGGVASANGGHDYDEPADFAVNNLQLVDCEQAFDGGALFAPVGSVAGDTDQNIGNFCTVIGS